MKTTSAHFPWLVVSITGIALSACSLAPSRVPAPEAATAAESEPADFAGTPAADQPRFAVPLNALATRESPTIVTAAESEAFVAAPVPRDLIGRIRDGFVLPVVDEESVRQELTWFAANPEYITRVFERSRSYLHYIATELESRGMPADLALLPIVESAFDPLAYSRGRASGLWQIIPSTGDHLGLRQNWWYDGRRDVIESTRAALDYLEMLHARFEGDWLLAIAAYNLGEGRLSRTIERAEREGRPVDFFSLQDEIRTETARYVPKLLAIRDLVADPGAFGIELPTIDDEPYFAVVETGGQIDLALAADLAALEIETLQALNPGINRWATDPEGPHRLVVPIETADTMRDSLASLDATERVRWTRHEIRSGETLIHIARRYETTPDVLREFNGLSGSLIRAGDYLMIPRPAAGGGMTGRAPAGMTQASAIRRVEYVVQRGDSLWAIAGRFRVSIDELLDWNSIAADAYLQPGQPLVLFVDVTEQST